MTLSSQKILELVTSKSGGIAGKAAAMRRSAGTGRAPGTGLSAEQRRFLDAFADRDGGTQTKAGSSTVQRPPRKTPYSHPEQAARFVPNGSGRSGSDGRTGLEQADLIWLQRLPTDPTQVTFADAVTLASLMQLTKPNTADRRLAESVWAPVKRVHDLKAAEHELEKARQPLSDVPSSALGALTEAIRAEVPQLNDDEVVSRASSMLRDALDARSAERDARIATAEAQMAAVTDGHAHQDRLTA